MTLIFTLFFSSFLINTTFAEESVDNELNHDISNDNPDEFGFTMSKNDEVDIFGGNSSDELADEMEFNLFEVSEDNEFAMFSLAEPASSLTIGFLQPTGSSSQTINVYKESGGYNKITYLSASVAYTGVIPFVDYSNGRYRIIVSGVDGWVEKTHFRAYSVDTPNLKVNHFTPTKEGTISHWISRAAINTTPGDSYRGFGFGKSPVFLKPNVDYFSPDGHYFYNDTISMLTDLKNNTTERAINKNEPHYNYYQFVSYRTTSKLTAEQMESYLLNPKKLTAESSKMVGSSGDFVNQGLKYGGNPLISFAIAGNESNWGQSAFAFDRNNIFGHNAVDSNPGSASAYGSIKDAIANQNKYYVNNLYGKTNGGIYNGLYLGNKAHGMNVQYASDPFWGEKAANFYSVIDRHFNYIDNNQSIIGVFSPKENGEFLNVRKEADNSSNTPILYRIRNKGQAVDILSEVKGASVNGTDIWYKISSDAILDTNRNPIDDNSGIALPNEYNYSTNHGYVHSSYIKIVNGKPIVETDRGRKGDVNGVGGITLLDLALVRSHLLNNSVLSGDMFYRADVNGKDGITLLDLALIRSHLLGNSKLD